MPLGQAQFSARFGAAPADPGQVAACAHLHGLDVFVLACGGMRLQSVLPPRQASVRNSGRGGATSSDVSAGFTKLNGK